MSDLDGSTSSTVVKPKPLPINKSNVKDSSKNEAQNYFKSLSTAVKKPAPITEEVKEKDVSEK